MLIMPALLLFAAQAPTAPPPPSNSGAEKVLSANKGGVDDALGRAATRPMRDLNLMKVTIAPDLVAVMSNPYAVRSLRTCRQLNAEVNHMTVLVGPDVDDRALLRGKGRKPVERLFDTAEGVTGGLVPGQGLIRQLTGANKAARQVAAARLAGQLRRTYIKGIMKGRGCRLFPARAAARK